MPPEIKKYIEKIEDIICENCIFLTYDDEKNFICCNVENQKIHPKPGLFCTQGRWKTKINFKYVEYKNILPYYDK